MELYDILGSRDDLFLFTQNARASLLHSTLYPSISTKVKLENWVPRYCFFLSTYSNFEPWTSSSCSLRDSNVYVYQSYLVNLFKKSYLLNYLQLQDNNNWWNPLKKYIDEIKWNVKRKQKKIYTKINFSEIDFFLFFLTKKKIYFTFYY